MTRYKARGLLDRAFQVCIIGKGLDGLAELIGGLLLLLVTPSTVNYVVAGITRHELSEDPHDFIANHLLRIGNGLTGSSVHFAAAYLLLHGAVKVVQSRRPREGCEGPSRWRKCSRDPFVP